MDGYIKGITGIIPYTDKSVDIPLNGKHLIITGGNGSGKTSLLRKVYEKTVLFIVHKKQADLPKVKEQLRQYTQILAGLEKGSSQYDFFTRSVKDLQETIEKTEMGIQPVIPNNSDFSSKYDDRQAVALYFADHRLAYIAEAKTAQGLQSEIEENQKAAYNQKVGSNLEQHLLNLRARRSFAITEDNNLALAETIDAWFKEFEKNLQYLFEDDSAALHFDSNNNKFSIRQRNKPPCTFQTLSAGYGAIFDIYAELLMRTEYFKAAPAALEGAVFIDEIDLHLHVSLQRLILPFFTELFPNVQFIVTAHSPFVRMSTQDTIIYDLDKNEIVNESFDNR